MLTQVDPCCVTLLVLKRLKLEHNELFSRFAFNCNLRPSIKTCLEPDVVYRCSKNFIRLVVAACLRVDLAPGLAVAGFTC